MSCSLYLPIYVYYLSTYLPIYLSFSVYIHWFSLSVYLSNYLPIYPSIPASIYLSIHLSIVSYMSTYFVFSSYLYIDLSIRLSNLDFLFIYI